MSLSTGLYTAFKTVAWDTNGTLNFQAIVAATVLPLHHSPTRAPRRKLRLSAPDIGEQKLGRPDSGING